MSFADVVAMARFAEVRCNRVRDLPGGGHRSRCTDFDNLLSNNVCNRVVAVNQLRGGGIIELKARTRSPSLEHMVAFSSASKRKWSASLLVEFGRKPPPSMLAAVCPDHQPRPVEGWRKDYWGDRRLNPRKIPKARSFRTAEMFRRPGWECLKPKGFRGNLKPGERVGRGWMPQKIPSAFLSCINYKTNDDATASSSWIDHNATVVARQVTACASQAITTQRTK